MNVKEQNGAIYFITFIDRFSRITQYLCCLIAPKLLIFIELFVAEFENIKERSIKALSLINVKSISLISL